MRTRPKQVNYLAKFGQQKAEAVSAHGGAQAVVELDAIRSADRLVESHVGRAPVMVPKKPLGPSRVSGGRGAINVQQERQSQQVSAVSNSRETGGKIAQFRSLDDLPNQFEEGNFEPPSRDNAIEGTGAKPRLVGISALADDGNDYWTAPIKPKSQIQKSQQNQVPVPAADTVAHFGRTGAQEEDYWGMSSVPVAPRAHDPAGGEWAQHDGYSPPPPGQISGPGLVLRDDGKSEVGAVKVRSQAPTNVKPFEKRIEIRHNNEYSPKNLPAAAISPRMRPPQNIIPKLDGLRAMQPAVDYYEQSTQQPHAHYRQPQHKPDVSNTEEGFAVDHGFSPPRRKLNDQSLLQPSPNRELPARAQPQQVYNLPPKEEEGYLQKVLKKPPPPLPAMLNRRNENDDDDDWNDQRSGRRSGRSGKEQPDSGRSHGARGNAKRYVSPIQDRDQGPSMDYDDDSVDEDAPIYRKQYNESPKKGLKEKVGLKSAIPLVRNVHPNDDFRAKYQPDEEPRRLGRIHVGGHVRKGAPQRASPRSSVDSNSNAPPLPHEANRARISTADDELPENEKLHYSKAPRKVEYKPYTLADYKEIKHNTYVIVPKLQPDLNSDALIAKRANQQRVKDFSKQLKEFNRVEIQNEKLSHVSKDDEKKELSKREKAIQYGKQVRTKVAAAHVQDTEKKSLQSGKNPSVKHSAFSEEDDDWHGSDYNSEDRYVKAADVTGMRYENAKHIEELESQHNDAKRQIDAIKRALKL